MGDHSSREVSSHQAPGSWMVDMTQGWACRGEVRGEILPAVAGHQRAWSSRSPAEQSGAERGHCSLGVPDINRLFKTSKEG